MGFITRSIFVCKFIISGLKPVHLNFLYLQNKKRLLQGVAAEEIHVMVRHNPTENMSEISLKFQ